MAEKRYDQFESLEGIELTNLIGLKREYAERCSALFIAQLKQGLIDDPVHPDNVVDQIKTLEEGRPSITEPPRQFRANILKGLWYKHYFQANHIPRNCMNEMKLTSRNSRKFHQLFQKVAKTTSDQRLIAARLSYELSVGAWEARARKQKVTGERIIFARHEGANFYLTLSWHIEPDDKVAERLRSCVGELPFLFEG